VSGRVVLVGAGAHGRGTLEILRARSAAGLDAPEVVGFVDDHAPGESLGGLPVLGDVRWLAERAGPEGLGAILALADPAAKRALAERLEPVVASWEVAVHPTAVLATGVTVAPGAIVSAGVIVAHDTRIEGHTTINLGATIGHDCRVGRFSTVAPGVNVTGNVSIGEGAVIQTNATVVPGRTIGDGARIGPGAVLLRDAEAGGLYMGNPARRMPDPADRGDRGES
jgi:sugar O-acyltransferase (sialic acid O-acetyltransferase NeuD family)